MAIEDVGVTVEVLEVIGGGGGGGGAATQRWWRYSSVNVVKIDARGSQYFFSFFSLS